MKIKSVLTGFCLVAVTLTSKADYNITFQTFDAVNDPGLTQHIVFDIDGTTKLAGDSAFQFVGRLFVGPVGGALNAIDTGSTAFAPNGSGGEGYIAGSTILVTDASLNAGSQAQYRLRAWSSQVGGVAITSFAQALATPGAHVGESQLTGIILGGTDTTTVPPSLRVATANLHPSFTLSLVPAAVPEPSVLALGLLGGAALLFRRRK